MSITRFILFFLIFVSCKRQQVHELIFDKEYLVSGEIILESHVSIRKLIKAGRYLFALQSGDEYFIKVFDSDSLQELGEFARKGSGPNEFPTALIVDRVLQCIDGVFMWVHDLNAGLLCRINITESLKEQSTVIDKKFKTKPESGFFTAFFIDSTKVIGRSSNSIPQMYRLQFYNPKQDTIFKTIQLFPFVKRKRDDLDYIFRKYNYLYTSHIGINNNNTKIASAMSSFNRIDIFDTNGVLEKSVIEGIEIPKEDIQEYLAADIEDNSALMVYYNAIYTTDNYIYALYYGQSMSEYGINPISTEIRVFDWDGNPMCKLKVSDYLLNFSIDEERGFMYGVDYFNGKSLRYNICINKNE